MPELAEVAYYARRWEPAVGERILRVHAHAQARVFRHASAAAVVHGLTGRALRRVETHGKQMCFRFSEGAWLGVHLGMTGELRAESADYAPQKHDHCVLFTKKRALVFNDSRMFGCLLMDLKERGEPAWWADLPPAILHPAFTVDWVGAALRRRARTPIKAALLDQALFPGIGNWMADEIAWQLALHPARLSGEIEAKALHRAIVKVTRGAMRWIAADWSDPPKSWLFQHRWKPGGHCPRCRAELSRDDLRGRTACWCPECQTL
jgi:formamidopyrimidine-DNA glycosylase